MSKKFFSINNWELAAREFSFKPHKAAQFCGVSPRHFQRLFWAKYHKAPRDWMQAVQLRVAKDLLRAGTSIKQVAAEVGFLSVQAFSKWFKHLVGVPPLQFIKQTFNAVTDVRFGQQMSDLDNTMSGLNNV